MYDLNNIGQSQTTGVGDFFRGIGTGLHALVENKTKEIQRQKNIDKLQRIGFNPQAAELLNHIQEVDPAHFSSVLQSLGEGAYAQPQQQGVQSLEQPAIQSGEVVAEKPKGLFKNKAADERAQAMRETATEKRLEPFLKGISEDYNISKQLYAKSRSMLENLQKNKAKFEKLRVAGALIDPNSKAGKILYSDPDVRKYIADSNGIVTLLANSRKGQPTNFKIRFEQLSKPDISQPVKTQEDLLRGIEQNAKDVFKVNKFVNEQQAKHGGKTPGNIREMLISQGIEDIFAGAEEELPEGSQYEENGKIFEIKNGQPVEIGAANAA